MVKQTIEVTNSSGLHARPAADFVKIATTCPCEVFLEKDGTQVNAKSILGLLSLAIGQGQTITVITDGKEESVALNKLVDFVRNLAN